MNFEKLNEVSCRIDGINEGDRIPIGGSFMGVLDLTITVDESSFQAFFEKVEANAKNIAVNKSMREWLEPKTDFDPELFAQIYAFDAVMRKMYPNMSENFANRRGFYDSEGSKKLSDAVAEKVCACAEMALLTQLYFQRQGIDAKYFGGELLHSRDDEFGEAHSFVTFKSKGKDYIYDPANPLIGTDDAVFPRISSMEVTPAQMQQFENKICSTDARTRKCVFLETKDILAGMKLYYGCGDGCNIWENSIISKHTPATTAPQGQRD